MRCGLLQPTIPVVCENTAERIEVQLVNIVKRPLLGMIPVSPTGSMRPSPNYFRYLFSSLSRIPRSPSEENEGR